MSNDPEDPEDEVLPVKLSKTLRGAHPLVSKANQQLLSAETHKNEKIIPPTDAALRLAVGIGSLPRALRIMDSLIKHLIGLKYEVLSGPIVVIDGIKVRFGIEEEVRLPPENLRTKNRDRRFYGRPIGLLMLRILSNRYWAKNIRWEWKESKMQPMEKRLGAFVDGLISFATKGRAFLDEEKQKRVAFERAVEDWREAEAARKARNEALKKEKQLFQGLFKQARDLKRSRIIREFVAASEAAHLTKHGAIDPDSEFAKWVKWANAHADRLDPFVASMPSIMDEKPDKIPYDRPIYDGNDNPERYFQ